MIKEQDSDNNYNWFVHCSFASSRKSKLDLIGDGGNAAPTQDKNGTDPAMQEDEPASVSRNRDSISSEGSGDEEGDGTASKYKKKHDEEKEYEDDGGEEAEEEMEGEWEEIIDTGW